MTTSQTLDVIQKHLTTMLKTALDAYDFDYAENLLSEIKTVDSNRRKAWHDEKFGAYENIADEVLNFPPVIKDEDNTNDFCADDIPF